VIDVEEAGTAIGIAVAIEIGRPSNSCASVDGRAC